MQTSTDVVTSVTSGHQIVCCYFKTATLVYRHTTPIYYV